MILNWEDDDTRVFVIPTLCDPCERDIWKSEAEPITLVL